MLLSYSLIIIMGFIGYWAYKEEKKIKKRFEIENKDRL